MVYSMTGFGRGEASSDVRKFTVEIRSINHRYCDVSIKMPRALSKFEDRVRKAVLAGVSRGKLEVFVGCEEFGERARKVTIDMGLAEAYHGAMRKLQERFGLLHDDITVTAFLRVPDILKVEDAEPDEGEVLGLLDRAVGDALGALVEMRGREGEKLIADIREKFSAVSELLDQVAARAPFVVEDYRARLAARIKELLGQTAPDEARLAMEVAVFADRCSVDEEIVRFRSHLSQAEKCCASGQPVGRKLDFILQEINREINTIGSKSNDLLIGGKVVEIKAEVEKIREQIQNLE
ncbi:MAG: YicC family protein [Clostridiales bacterium]|nr:YicC family protein [Clostridiales bacterium]